jgi:4-amino-4-deoxy-L-arabinose transferase-like glycosyltransferase
MIGTITIVFSAIACCFSWQFFRRRHDKAAILLLALAGLALRFFTASDMYLHDWDERYHALVAKNMMSHPLLPTLYDDPVLPYDYRAWTANHVWLHKPPVPLWFMAGSMAVFGVNERALRLPSVLLTTLGIWLIFVIGSYFFDRKTAYLAAFFFSVNGLILELAGGGMPTDHIDIFFLFFTELGVFFTVLFVSGQRPIYNILAGVSLGLAILSKWLPALIVLPVWLLLVIDSGKFSRRAAAGHFILLLAPAILVFMPWQVYIHRVFPREAAWEISSYSRHISKELAGNAAPFSFYLDKIRINYGELVYLPLIWLLYMIWNNPGTLKLWALAVWFFVPLVFFSCIRTKMQGYLLFTAPVLFLCTAAFFYRLDSWKKRFRYPGLINIVLLFFLALPVRYAIERSKPFTNRERNPGWVKELRAEGKQPIGARTVLFNYKKPVEAMFYTGMTVYKNIPDSAVIQDLQVRGYRVMINDDGRLAAEVKNLQGVVYREFR